MPEMSTKANRPPIKPPFILSKLDLMRREISKIVVAFKEAILIKASGAKGFNNIWFSINISYSKNKILKLLKLKKKGLIKSPLIFNF